MAHKSNVDSSGEDLKTKQQTGSETVNTENSVEAAGPSESEPAAEQVASVESVRAEMMDRVLRLQADFDNFRRRTRQEQSELGAFVTQNLVKELLPVVDNFERALLNRPAEDTSGFGAGVEMIFRQLYGVLEKLGVGPVETVGTMFDPNKHEAILTDAESDQPEGTIVAELQRGYAVSGKVVRPALVKVAGK